MKQPHVSKAINWYRLVLYLTALVLGGVGLYTILFLIPSFKSEWIQKIENEYQRAAFESAIEKCHKYIERYPKEPRGYLWLGRCYDGLAREIRQNLNLRDKYIKNIQNTYFHADEQREFQRQADDISQKMQKWQTRDFEKEALQAYEKAMQFGRDWQTSIEIVKSHTYMGRLERALEIIDKIACPNSLPEMTNHALTKMELYAKLEAQKKIDVQKLSQQCHQTLDLYQKLSKKEISKILQENQALPYLYLAKISTRDKDLKQAETYYQMAANFPPGRFAVYFDWAKLLYQQEKYAPAEQAFTQALALAPSANVYYELAKTQISLWNLSGSLHSLQQALYLEIDDPDLPIYHRALNDPVWLKWQNHPQWQMVMGYPRYKASLEIMRVLRATIYFQYKRQYNFVLASAEEILKQDDKNYAGHLLFLYCSIALKSCKLAWDQYIKEEQTKLNEPALSTIEKKKIKRDIEEVRQNLQKLGLDRFDLETCEKNIEKSILQLRRLYPSVLTELDIAYCYFRVSLLKGEQKIATLYPDTIKIIRDIADKAETPELRALCHHTQGYCHLQLKEYESAMTEFARAVQFAPTVPFYHFDYARALVECKKTKEATEEYLCTVQYAEKVPMFHYLTGREFIKLNDLVQARKRLEASVALQPNMEDGWYYLAKTYLLEGNQSQALIMLENAFKNRGNIHKLSKLLVEDPEWEKLRQHPELMRILSSYPAH